MKTTVERKPLQEEKTKTTERPATWGQQQRLEFIDFRLFWEGRLNRSDLMKSFAISLPQASLDLARYIEIAPRNIRYDKKEKAYFSTPEFKPAMAGGKASKYLDLLLMPNNPYANFFGWIPPTGSVQYPSRHVKQLILRQVLRSIRERQMLRIEYQSMNRPGPTIRAISPHAIGYDGFRWHVRAFCHEHRSFRDFVFARILNIRDAQPSMVNPRTDEAWERTLELILAPHPDLTPGQKRAIALDYRMKRGRVVLRTRQALAFYVLRQLGLDHSTGGPKTQHIVLLNHAELKPFLNDHE